MRPAHRKPLSSRSLGAGPGGEVSAQQLREKDPADLSIDRIVLELLATAKHVRRVHIVIGLVPGELTRALAGEQTGTVVTVD